MLVNAENWGQLSRLLDEALDLEPAQRWNWLESLPPEHAPLQATLRDLLFFGGDEDVAKLLASIDGFLRQVSRKNFIAGGLEGAYRLISELRECVAAQEYTGDSSAVTSESPRVAENGRALLARLQRECDIFVALDHPYMTRFRETAAEVAEGGYFWLPHATDVPEPSDTDVGGDFWRSVNSAESGIEDD